MPATRRCPQCGERFPETDEFFYRRPSADRFEYCTQPSGNGCHESYWASVRQRRRGPTDPPSERPFGVELELGTTELLGVRDVLSRLGLPVSHGLDATYRTWCVKSEHCGIEVTTPILRGKEGRAEVKAACSAVAKAGYQAAWGCGLHVHHDVEDLTLEQVKRAYRFWFANQRHINALVAPSRRDDGYATDITHREMERIEKLELLPSPRKRGPRSDEFRRATVYLDRTMALSIQSYLRHGTLEARKHQGTVDGKKVVAWVDFVQAVIETARSEIEISHYSGSKEEMFAYESTGELLAGLEKHGGLSRGQSDYLRSRATSLERRAARSHWYN